MALVNLFFYVPESALQEVKAAVFAAGAGRVGDYAECCWQIKGEGQYRPLAGSQPYIGALDELSKTAEYRVELTLEKNLISEVKEALLQAHPYEEVAYGFVDLIDI